MTNTVARSSTMVAKHLTVVARTIIVAVISSMLPISTVAINRTVSMSNTIHANMIITKGMVHPKGVMDMVTSLPLSRMLLAKFVRSMDILPMSVGGVTWMDDDDPHHEQRGAYGVEPN
jgi:hypothetical protein